MPHRPQLAAALSLLVAACSTTSATHVREQLDERTGVTVTSLPAPLEFYSAQPAAGLQAASFAYLAPLEINRMGQRNIYVWLSVLRGAEEDGDAADAMMHGPFDLRIVAGSDTVVPAFVSAEARELGLGQPVYQRPAQWVGEAFYAVTLQDIARMAAAADTMAIELSARRDEPRRYDAWKVDPGRLRAFAERIRVPVP